MGRETGIEWTDATWNPTTGCTKVSAGCENCYAEALAHRLLKDTYTRKLPVVDTPENRADPFAVRVWPERLDEPQGWEDPRLVFVNSMSDLFHKEIPEDFLLKCFEVMLNVDRHTYQILTKRPARAAEFVAKHRELFGDDGLPEHIWIGTSVENQDVAYRIRHLVDVPAAVRFLSCEPLIGPLRLSGTGFADGIHWVIVGGESGPNRRVIRKEWVTALRDECQAAGVPFFFKQWGGSNKKKAGRLLQGRTWSQMPSSGATSGAAPA